MESKREREMRRKLKNQPTLGKKRRELVEDLPLSLVIQREVNYLYVKLSATVKENSFCKAIFYLFFS